MILVRVRDDERQQVLANGFNEGKIWHDQINARQFRPREGDAEIDQNPLATLPWAETIKRGVHADFAKAAQGREDKLVL